MSELTTIDLFCGAGGITEGFRQAGFKCLAANDFNSWAMETFKLNHPDAMAVGGPIEHIDTGDLRRSLGVRRGDLAVLVGGPPCQGFSINAPERFVEDPRNSMFRHYIRFLDEFMPRRFLFENVPGMLSLAGGRIFDQIIAEFTQRGYRVSAKILLAAHYGVPQVRWRLILLGARDGAGLEHPQPTHFYEARPNFTGGATMTMRPLPLEALSLRPAVDLRDAIYDLPELTAAAGDEVSSYDRKPHSAYARQMRRDSKELFNHTSNALSRINLERLRHIPPGGSWTSIPFELLPAGMQKAKRGDHTKRYGRPAWTDLSGTMMTKCDPHWGAVYHPEQQRTFSVRECARLQSFPDTYRFLGPRVAQYEQVGNAVPVLLSRTVANTIRQSLAEPLKEYVRTANY